jgi:hypothetical protein
MAFIHIYTSKAIRQTQTFHALAFNLSFARNVLLTSAMARECANYCDHIYAYS